jgi:hypothetical protein
MEIQENHQSDKRVLEAARVIAANLDGGEQRSISALIAAGFEVGEAHRFAAFLPMAFSRPVLERLGVSTTSNRVAVTADDGAYFTVELDHQPEYVAGLRVARVQKEMELAPPEVFKKIALASADLDAANVALNAGSSLSGATFAAAIDSLYAPYVIR